MGLGVVTWRWLISSHYVFNSIVVIMRTRASAVLLVRLSKVLARHCEVASKLIAASSTAGSAGRWVQLWKKPSAKTTQRVTAASRHCPSRLPSSRSSNSPAKNFPTNQASFPISKPRLTSQHPTRSCHFGQPRAFQDVGVLISSTHLAPLRLSRSFRDCVTNKRDEPLAQRHGLSERRH